MKLIHLSDLHIGKRVNEFSMLDDQSYILGRIVEITNEEKPDAVIISGDAYDKPVPSAEAVECFDGFLSALSKPGRAVFCISGNHDSPERIAFGSSLMRSGGVYMSPVYSGRVEPVILRDGFGEVRFYMLPFIKPAGVRAFFPDAEIDTYTGAVAEAVKSMGLDTDKRNVLICHQFVTGASRSDSEEISVGGSDNVDAGAFAGFDYVALGHLHGPQNVGSGGEPEVVNALPVIRYCGSPLKYSFSEVSQKKSVTVAELEEKGTLRLRTVPLVPKRDMRQIRGDYMTLTAKSTYEGTAADDYLRIILTDENDIPDAAGKLRTIYPNLMKLDYDNLRTRASGEIIPDAGASDRTPLELFDELYEKQNNQPMSGEQKSFIETLIENVWEDGR